MQVRQWFEVARCSVHRHHNPMDIAEYCSEPIEVRQRFYASRCSVHRHYNPMDIAEYCSEPIEVRQRFYASRCGICYASRCAVPLLPVDRQRKRANAGAPKVRCFAVFRSSSPQPNEYCRILQRANRGAPMVLCFAVWHLLCFAVFRFLWFQ